MSRSEVRVGFFLLAAGKCERFGFPKFLFPICGQPVLKRLLSICENISKYTYIISGAYHNVIVSKVGLERVVYNPLYEEGISSSLRLAAEKASELSLDALVVILSDQPFISTSMLNELLNAFKDGYNIVVFEKFGKPCPPSLFGKYYFKTLMKLHGDVGAKKIIEEAGEKKIIKGYDSLLEDFDTIWDYLRLTSKKLCDKRRQPSEKSLKY